MGFAGERHKSCGAPIPARSPRGIHRTTLDDPGIPSDLQGPISTLSAALKRDHSGIGVGEPFRLLRLYCLRSLQGIMNLLENRNTGSRSHNRCRRSVEPSQKQRLDQAQIPDSCCGTSPRVEQKLDIRSLLGRTAPRWVAPVPKHPSHDLRAMMTVQGGSSATSG